MRQLASANRTLRKTMAISDELVEPPLFVVPYRPPWIGFTFIDRELAASRQSRCQKRDSLREEFKLKLEEFRVASYMLDNKPRAKKIEHIYMQCVKARTAYGEHLQEHGCFRVY